MQKCKLEQEITRFGANSLKVDMQKPENRHWGMRIANRYPKHLHINRLA